MKILCFLLNTTLIFFFHFKGMSQLPYSVPMYSINKDSAVSFGVVDNYCGRKDTLKMNIYNKNDNFINK